MQRIIGSVNALSKWGGYGSAVCLFLAMGMIVVHVFFRKILNAPLLFGEEVSTYLMLCIIFLGLGHTMKTGGNVRVDLLIGHVSPRARLILDKLCTVLAVLFTTIFFIGNFVVVKQFYVRGIISTQDLKLPLVIPGTVMVIGSLMLLLQLLARLFSKGVPED